MAQAIIVFENILNGGVLLQSKEIKALCNHQFGGCDLTIGATDKTEEFHDWLNDELHKSITHEYGQVYIMKVPFSDLEGENETGEYFGPVCVHLFEPDAAIDDGILLLTCNWKGRLFSNDHYVCGIVADEDDLARMLGKVDGKLTVSREDSPVKEEPTFDPKKLTTNEVIKYLNDLTNKADKVRSFSQLEVLDDKKREFWNSLDDKTKQLKTVIAAKKKYDDKSFVMSIVLANR